jgi:SAM-dependent methyltransferase
MIRDSGGADQVIGLYQRHAHAWASDRGTAPAEGDWLRRFRALLPEHAAVLDIGCGSGDPIARFLAEAGCAVTGVDSAPAMIGMCQAKLPGHKWHVGDMRSLDLNAVFDGLLAWDSFFHLCPADQRLMFPLFRKHALAHAVLMFTSGTSLGKSIGSFCGEKLYHGSLNTEEYRALLAANGFAVLAHRTEDPDCGGRTVWLAQAELV